MDANNNPVYISVTSDPNNTVNVTVTGLPIGLTFNPADNSITGVPSQIGNFNVVISALDVTTNTTASVTSVMKVVDPAIVFAPVLPDATAGILYGTQLSATGGDAPFNYALSTGTLPAGLSLDSTTGNITGTPTVAGTFPLSFIVTDSVGSSTTATVILNIISQAKVCSGNNDIVSAVNNTWLDVAGGLTKGGKSIKFAPSVTYATGVTKYAVGQWITYSGITDDAGQYCLPSIMSVSAQLKVPTPSFTTGTLNTSYSSTFSVTGGWSPYTIVVTGLPSGLGYNIVNGVNTISGTPLVTGTFPITISVTDTKGNKFQNTTSSITINATSTACTKPTGSTTAAEVVGTISAKTSNSITVNGKVINLLPCTAITWNGNWSGMTKSIQVGYKADMTKGYVSNGAIYATSLIIDNGL